MQIVTCSTFSELTHRVNVVVVVFFVVVVVEMQRQPRRSADDNIERT